jgi:hypothetical protein
MLEAYLPRRYSVRNGFVVDHKGKPSEQIDVIIHDAQYSPFLFQAGTSCFVPAESVYAVFDVKQEISGKTLREAGAKVASVRRLNRTSGKIWTFDSKEKDGKDPNDQPILGGILAVTSKYKPRPFGPAFVKALNKLGDKGPKKDHHLDVGVAVSHGAFESQQADPSPIVYEGATALVGFFMAFVRRLQPLGTALAMNLNVWGESLRE